MSSEWVLSVPTFFETTWTCPWGLLYWSKSPQAVFDVIETMGISDWVGVVCHSFDLSSGVLFKRIVDLVCIAGVKVWSVSVYAGMHGLINCHRVSCMDWYCGGVGNDIFCGLHWGCLLCGVWCVGCESCWLITIAPHLVVMGWLELFEDMHISESISYCLPRSLIVSQHWC